MNPTLFTFVLHCSLAFYPSTSSQIAFLDVELSNFQLSIFSFLPFYCFFWNKTFVFLFRISRSNSIHF